MHDVQVGGGACDPTHCSVTGAATQGMVRAWEESNVLVTAADRYGTPCITGGRVVTAELKPASKKLQPLTVDAVDNDDGTYRIPLLIMREGVRALPATPFTRGLPSWISTGGWAE